jgi:hypothetical protein
MTDLLFRFLSFSPGPFWLILFIIPRNQTAMRCFDGYLYLLAALFAVQTIPVVPELLPAIASPTLPVIQSFLGSATGTVGAWNHMILGDLWIGRWVCHDAIRLEMPAFLRIPVLIVILFFGPLGLFLYLCYRFFLKRKFKLTEFSA